MRWLFRLFSSSFILMLGALVLGACGHLYYVPSPLLFADPRKAHLQVHEVTFNDSRGHAISGWHFPSNLKSPKGTIVQFHGNAENMTSHFRSLAWIVPEGYELFCFDYKGYGKTPGLPSPEETTRDGLAALETAFALHEKSKSLKFVVYAQSLGVAVATRAILDFKNKDQIDLLVLDSGFTSYQKVAHTKFQNNWLTYWLTPLTYLLVSDAESAQTRLAEIKTPALIIHDRLDPVVPYDQSEDTVLRLGSDRKTFWTLEKSGHVGVFFGNPKHRKDFLSVLEKS